MVQRVIELNEALIKAQQRRLEEQSSLSSIQAAIRNGEDLQQYFLALEGSIGRELVMAGLGFNSQDVTIQSDLEKSVLEDQAELRTLQEYYGPVHPRVIQIQQRIGMNQQYLASYQTKVNERLSQMRDKQLGPLLLQMERQRLNEAWQHEAALRMSFEQARVEAVALIGDRERLQLLEHDLKFLRDLRDVLLSKIASVDLRQDHGDIRTAVVSEPTLPKTPVWPKLPLVVAGCLALGLGSGLGLIYVLDILDDRFRSPDEMRIQLGAPVLAMVRQMDDLHAIGLENIHVHVAPDALASESFRTLRTTLAFSGQETARLVVSSPEPGDGKTTVLSNLAVSFYQSGKRTLLIDGDMRRPGLTAQMGLKGQAGLADCLVSDEAMATVATAHVRALASGLDFLPAGGRRLNPGELLASQRFADLLAWAETHYDQILIDSPPALAATDAAIIGRVVDGVVLVVQPKKNRRRLVMRAAESFTSVGVNLLGVVVNRVGGDKADVIYGYGAESGYGYGYGQDEKEWTSADPADSGQNGPSGPVAGANAGSILPRRVA